MSQALSQAEHISDFDFEVTWYKVINIDCILSSFKSIAHCSKIGNLGTCLVVHYLFHL